MSLSLRFGPMLHEAYTLTTANGKRMAIVEDMAGVCLPGR